jgi:hypothetical protein
VFSLTSSSGGYINGRNSANLELLIDKRSSIYLCVKLKAGICRSDAAFIFLVWLINKLKYITCAWTHHDNKLKTIGSATILFKDSVLPSKQCHTINFEIRANTKNKLSRNQVEEIRWISTQSYVTPYDKTEKTTDVP